MKNKDIAAEFLKSVASGRVREAYDKFVSDGFRHHNAYFRGDRESLMKAMEENAAMNPHKQLEIKIAMSEGEMVATYSRIRHKPGDRGAAVVHIFRFEGGRIAELWDVGMAVPEDSPNENGMF